MVDDEGSRLTSRFFAKFMLSKNEDRNDTSSLVRRSEALMPNALACGGLRTWNG